MNPLSADVEQTAVVVAVDNGDTETNAGANLHRAFLTIYIIIRCSIACTHAITDALVESAAHGARCPLGTHIIAITILEQTRLQGIGLAIEMRIVDFASILDGEIGTHAKNV